jgi:ABC-type xylose transport system permease subunit
MFGGVVLSLARQPVQAQDTFGIIGRCDIPISSIGIPLPLVITLVWRCSCTFSDAHSVGISIYAWAATNGKAYQASAPTAADLVYSLCAFLTAIGVMMTARLGVASPTATTGYDWTSSRPRWSAPA